MYKRHYDEREKERTLPRGECRRLVFFRVEREERERERRKHFIKIISAIDIVGRSRLKEKPPK